MYNRGTRMKSGENNLGNSQKRQTGLINKGIIQQTEKIYPDEIELILTSTNLMRRITSVSKDAIKEMSEKPNLYAVMNLFARNRELVHFSTVSMMNAGYSPTKVLSRAALENTLCMRLFNKKPELAQKWFTNPDEFRKEWKPHNIRDELFLRKSSLWKSYNHFYWGLCNYSHPSFRGWMELIHEKSVLWRPIFNEDFASECIGLTFFIIFHSLQQFAEAFKEWFDPQLLKEVYNTGLQVSQMIRRHFQVK